MKRFYQNGKVEVRWELKETPMTQELTVQNLGDAVRDNVRKAMMDSIPEPVLQGLIEKEFQNFFAEKKEYNRTDPSPFQLLVRKEIEKMMEEKIRERIREQVATCVHTWDGNGNRLVGDLVEAMAPAAMSGVMRQIAEQCISRLR